MEGIFPNCVLRIISINKYRMPCSISENITQFSTNTRRKTFSLFIYSMGVEKKNGSLQQQPKTKIQKTTQDKQLQITSSFVVSHMVYLFGGDISK